MTSNPLYDLLIVCCQYEIDSSSVVTSAAMINNWDEVMQSAYMHGIFPVVYTALRKSGVFEGAVEGQFKAKNFEIAQNNLLMTSELLDIVDILTNAGIKVLAIKGPVLSHLLYGDVTQRQYSDLDVLVEPKEIYNAVKLLCDQGYDPEHSISFLRNRMLLKIGKDFAITSLRKNIHIEFHWRLFTDRQLEQGNLELFSEHNPSCIIHNHPVLTLEHETQLLYLLVHGSKHYWERIEWICDIDRFIRSVDVQWQSLVKRTEEMELSGMVFLGLQLAHDLFKTPIDNEILIRIEAQSSIRKASETIIGEIRSNAIIDGHSDSIDLNNLRKISLTNDTPSKRLREYVATLFEIKKWDVYVVNLPWILSPLYYFIRLYRLFKENILRVKN